MKPRHSGWRATARRLLVPSVLFAAAVSVRAANVDRLLERLAYHDPNARVKAEDARFAASRALALEKDPRIVPALRVALEDESALVRLQTVQSLYCHDWRPKTPAEQALVLGAKRRFDECADLGSVAVKPLILGLRNGYPEAAFPLSRVGGAEAVEALAEAMDTTNTVMKQAVISGLRFINTPQSLARLEERQMELNLRVVRRRLWNLFSLLAVCLVSLGGFVWTVVEAWLTPPEPTNVWLAPWKRFVFAAFLPAAAMLVLIPTVVVIWVREMGALPADITLIALYAGGVVVAILLLDLFLMKRDFPSIGSAFWHGLVIAPCVLAAPLLVAYAVRVFGL